ncbi:uncharacterized protein LOC119071782 [Bradysia coprophila]|uniref:uncharacterized protein LOC119071782 n=1 Tax=Bradysia coprophila TaxID=38358 RepID=UPI00187DC153|nr:uncharacterized protein LOC119071782 [Bradysia coprophila]
MEAEEAVSRGVKRSLSGDEIEENDEKKIKSPPESSAENGKILVLLDLNDDCLYQIFSNLVLYDLTNAADTCVRLRDCATYVFEHYHKCCILFDYRTGGGVNHTEVRTAVRIFGPTTTKLTLNMQIFHKLFSSDSALSMVNHYCKSLDTIILNGLKFTKWFPAKYVEYDFDPDSDPDSDAWNDNYDSDDDRDWIVGYVSPKFLTNLPRVKNVVVNKAMLFCGGRLFDDWKDNICTLTMEDVLVGDGFLKALRNSYVEVNMVIRNETRRGRGNIVHNNFRIVEALFTPKGCENALKTE